MIKSAILFLFHLPKQQNLVPLNYSIKFVCFEFYFYFRVFVNLARVSCILAANDVDLRHIIYENLMTACKATDAYRCMACCALLEQTIHTRTIRKVRISSRLKTIKKNWAIPSKLHTKLLLCHLHSTSVQVKSNRFEIAFSEWII